MKKISSIILLMFCIFSFSTCFNEQYVTALPFDNQEQTTQAVAEKQSTDDVLEKPVFEPEKKQTQTKQITSKLSSIVIKIFGGTLLLLVVIICLSFIWVANIQRRNEKRKKRMSADGNVINAVDNFARHRIKK